MSETRSIAPALEAPRLGAPEPATLPATPGPGTPPYRILLIDDTVAIHGDFRKILAADDAVELDHAEAELFGSSNCPSHRSSFALDSAYQGQEGLKLLQQALAEGSPYA